MPDVPLPSCPPASRSWPKVDKRCWTDFDDYTCFDASHYCLVRGC